MTARRAWVAFVIFLVVVINFMDRIALAVAARPLVEVFGFTSVQLGYLFSAFLWSYVICLVPLGLLNDRVKPRTMVGGAMAIWSAATLLMGVVSSYGGMIVSRLLMGAGEAATFPACGRVIRDWFPERERGVVTALFNGGCQAGAAIGALFTAALVGWIGWRAPFVLLGIVGFVWMVFWFAWYGAPKEVKWLPSTERLMLLEVHGADESQEQIHPASSSLLFLLSHSSIWGIVLTQACLVYTAFLFLSWLPMFLETSRHLTEMQTGYWTAAPYLLAVLLSVLIAHISDRMLSTADIKCGRRRKFVAFSAAMSLLILLATVVTNVWGLLAVLTLVLTGCAGGAGLNFTLASDILENPRDVPKAFALTAFGGNTFGLAAPIITGYLIQRTGGYQIAFHVAGALLLCGLILTLTLTHRPVPSQHRLHRLPASL
jgi:MFS family permease